MSVSIRKQVLDAARLRSKAKLPTASFLTQQQIQFFLEKEDVDCGICGEHDANDPNAYFFLFECGHYFHSQCSMLWFKSQNVEATCPMCRASVKETMQCAILATKFPTFSCPTNHGCAICYKTEDFSQWISLECGHTYHHQCFTIWLERLNVCVLCNQAPLISTEQKCYCVPNRSHQ